MIDAVKLFEQVAVLVLIMIPGFLLGKFKLVGDGFGKWISNVILYAAQPALIIMGFVSVDFGTEVLLRMGAVFVLAIVAHLLFFGVALLFFRKAPAKRRSVLLFSTVFTNAGYMGIPLLESLFLDTHPEIAIYGSVYVTAFNIFVWSLGSYLYTGDKKYISVKKMIVNPATLSTFVGLAIFFLSAIPAVRNSLIIPYIRGEVSSVFPSFMNSMKALVAPLAMLLIGFRFVDLKFKSVFKDKYLYINLFVTLFLTPALIWAIVKLLAVTHIYDDELVMSVLLLSAAAPAATATSMFAEKYDGDSPYASLIVSVTSVFCIISMPIVALLTMI